MPPSPVIERVSDALAEIANVTIHYNPAPIEPTSGAFLTINSASLHPALADVLANEYPSGFFRHQGVAIEHILGGTNTVVATQTSSGKSLI